MRVKADGLEAAAYPPRSAPNNMRIKFKAQDVSYSEALGGDIIQVSFAEKDSDDLHVNPYKYLLISVNYEFPPSIPKVEWCDGNDFNGGAKIVSYVFSKESLQMTITGGIGFDISFEADKNTINSIDKFLLEACK